ncbi:type 4 pilus biogenesis operon protein [Corallococcus coralloides]|uniref:Type 4 pilus biogenesis operon protein n=1 Tax=Corallococcus coralloides TaxID=184914 RepID=A0A410RKX8_CORCK|nr:prepilin-type N-terminal cleavage/methylation domain-containing protein [Corallococcus coralloides]QAT82561.1 type 4 pilus biogenesis operon protein [Corallococcus coralloides]
MKDARFPVRGFTLLEVMIASALGVMVLTTGLVVGAQMQKRAIFEEQTMTAQVTGRAVKEMLSLDITRAGAGMGNAPISFLTGGVTDERSAITVWRQPDLKTGANTPFGEDADFEPPPAGFPASDAIQLYWGDTNGMVTLAACGSGKVRQSKTEFCAKPNASAAMVTPSGPTSAIMVSGGNRPACPVRITGIAPSATTPSTITVDGALAESPVCEDFGSASTIWTPKSGSDVVNWLALRLSGAAYRVNWKGGIPTLEYLAPGALTWSVLSRDVEQLTVREGVVDFDPALKGDPTRYYELEWYPSVAGETNHRNPGVPHPAISECDEAKYNLDACKTDDLNESGNALPALATYPAADRTKEVIKRLRQRVRELEVTLVVRTRRINRDADMTGTDDEGLTKDGYTRRRYTFRVAARNMTVGLQRPADPSASGTP